MLAPLTIHARVRMQQRGIPSAALEALLDDGPDDALLIVGHRRRRFGKP